MAPTAVQESILSAYDSLLVLKITSQASLKAAKDYTHNTRDIASKTAKRLLIYAPVTPFWKHSYSHPTKSFPDVQLLLSELYIVATSALHEDVPVDVVLQVLRGEGASDTLLDFQGSIRPENLHLQFTNVEIIGDSDDTPNGQTSMASRQEEEGDDGIDSSQQKRMGTIALGGTFDHLHAGHKILLTMACWLAEQRVIVGITDDILLKNKSDRDLLESLEVRTSAVKNFLELVCFHLQHDLPALQDVYGPTATDPDVQGLIFSEETRKGATSIAELRKERNLSPLESFVISVISSDAIIDTDNVSKEDMLKAKMGSTQIRRRLRERKECGEKLPQ